MIHWIIDIGLPWIFYFDYPATGLFRITSYQIFAIIGISIAYFVLIFSDRKKRIFRSGGDLDLFFGFAIIACFIVSGIFTFSFNVIRDVESFQIEKIYLYGGYTSLAGILGLTFFVILYSKISKNILNKTEYFNSVTHAGVIGMAIGRLGCLTSGCCYGKEHEGLISVIYNTEFIAPVNITLIPIQLYEVFVLLLIALMIHHSYKRNNDYAFINFFILYPVWRFLAEFFRGGSEHEMKILLNMNIYQIISVMFLVSSVSSLLFFKRRNSSMAMRK